jgi:hypothetical protein
MERRRGCLPSSAKVRSSFGCSYGVPGSPKSCRSRRRLIFSIEAATHVRPMWSTILILFRTLFLILGGYEKVALENLALREQLGILQRSVQRPKIRQRDRLFWVCLQRVWRQLRSALVVVRPETVLDWQRRRFRRYWSHLSRQQNPGRPRTAADVGKLIKRMAETSVGWGAPRIHGELLKGCKTDSRNDSSVVENLLQAQRLRYCRRLRVRPFAADSHHKYAVTRLPC